MHAQTHSSGNVGGAWTHAPRQRSAHRCVCVRAFGLVYMHATACEHVHAWMYMGWMAEAQAALAIQKIMNELEMFGVSKDVVLQIGTAAPTCAHTHAFMRAHVSQCACAHTCTRTHTCTHACTHTCMYECPSARPHTCTHTRIHARMHTADGPDALADPAMLLASLVSP